MMRRSDCGDGGMGPSIDLGETPLNSESSTTLPTAEISLLRSMPVLLPSGMRIRILGYSLGLEDVM
jgi:hypothetical protein